MSQLASRPNLKLAWRRITTGGNYQYKRLYRDLYYAYEVALEQNLEDLRKRLLGAAFQQRLPERLYVPKASGLHRPIALLNIEDQIVLQAFANLAAKRTHARRNPLQLKVVFSNVLEKPDSIFFFRRWQHTYQAFQKRIRKHYGDKLRWVGDFDLAAFYDTISHELLLKTLFPRTTNGDLDWIKQCLQTWSSDRLGSGHGHGLPQGPLASDFLAECFLLPIDLALQKRRGYMRYVDDVRLFGTSEEEVRSELIELERQCRERGLIPQSGKFAIKRAHSVRDAMGMLPSISDPQHEAGSGWLDQQEALRGFRSAIDGRPYRVTDKSRLRYVLFRAEPDAELLKLVVRLIPRHPEHTDAFFTYLGRFGYRKPIERLCQSLVETNPYPYVRSEAWHVLARYRRERRAAVFSNPSNLTTRALDIASENRQERFIERWGTCHFLCVSDDLAGSRHSKALKLKRQSPLLQALLAPVLPDVAFEPRQAVETYLRQTCPEPGLSVCAHIHERGVSLQTFGLGACDLMSQVANTLLELGVLSGPGPNIDPIAEVVEVRYGVPRGASWRKLLKSEYVHALGLLKQAEAVFEAGRSSWLTYQNSFNQTVFLALQRHLTAIGHPGACKTKNINGELINFGVTLEANAPFSKNCPTIGKCFREMNARRNRLPGNHPYDKKTATQSRHLRKQERNKFVGGLRGAYRDLSALMP